uniref:Chemokine interleukin-8-like domain-containing protein n=1 Tax=Accipiter nisus TaxID=211598 RepID=A0A8B9MCK7_9AVES
MQLLGVALALALLLSNLVPGDGLSLESLLTNMRCKCIKSTAQAINLGLILAIDITPPVESLQTDSRKLLACVGLRGVSLPCSLTLKKNKKVCVAPEAPWIQLLIHKLTQRYVTPSEQKTSSLSKQVGRMLSSS